MKRAWPYLVILAVLAALVVWVLSSGPVGGSGVARLATPTGGSGAPAPGAEAAEDGPEVSGRVAVPTRQPEAQAAAESDPKRYPVLPGTPETLFGEIADEAGDPVPGVWVFTDREAEAVYTDEAGRFEIPIDGALIGRVGRHLVAWRDGYEPLRHFVDGAGFLWLTLKASTPRPVRLVAKDSDVPVPLARVEIVTKSNPWSRDGFFDVATWIPVPTEPIVADAQGWAELPSGESYYVRVTAEGYLTDRKRVSEKTERLELEKDLPPVAVRLLLPDGTPLSHARLKARQTGRILQADENGWVELSGYDSANIWGIQIQWEDSGYHYSPGFKGLPAEAGQELVIEHFPRRGRVSSGGDWDPTEFEIATSGTMTGMGSHTWLPDPARTPDLLRWETLGPTGAFEVTDGWQGTVTAAHVRHRESHRLAIQAPLEGPGPYELELPPTYTLGVGVSAEPGAVLDGARILLLGSHFKEGLVANAALTEGRAEVGLHEGEYDVHLMRAGSRTRLRLGSVQMPAADHEEQFDLGRMRELSGVVTAADEPVFPCRVYLYVEESGWDPLAVATTDHEGGWRVGFVPDKDLMAHVSPADPWLRERPVTEYAIPDGEVTCEFEMEVGEIEFVAADLKNLDPTMIRVQRCPVDQAKEPRNYSRSFDMPDLSTGSARIVTTPCQVVLDTSWSFEVLENDSFLVPSAQQTTAMLRVLRAGLLVVSVSGEDCRLSVRFEAEPVDLDSLPEGAAIEARRARNPLRRAGMSGSALSLLPGTWRVSLTGPIHALDKWPRETLGAEGEWETEVRAEAGRVTKLIVEFDEAGQPAFRYEIVDP